MQLQNGIRVGVSMLLSKKDGVDFIVLSMVKWHYNFISTGEEARFDAKTQCDMMFEYLMKDVASFDSRVYSPVLDVDAENAELDMKDRLYDAFQIELWEAEQESELRVLPFADGPCGSDSVITLRMPVTCNEFLKAISTTRPG